MKRIISLVLLTVILATSFSIAGISASAKTYKYKNYAYTVQKDNTIKIIKYSGDYPKKLVIPSKINGKKVKTIGTYAFSGGNFSELTISKGIENIEEFAFYCCGEKELQLPNTIKKIEGYAFAENFNLKSIKIPDSVQYIGDCAFSESSKLSKIKIGKGLKYLDSGAFCLTPFENNEKNWECKGKSSVLYIDNYLVTSSRVSGELKVKEGTRLIASYSLSPKGDEKITKVVIPKSVKYINIGAFEFQRKLKSVKLSEGLLEIGSEAFYDCRSLKEIKIPKSVKKIEKIALGYTYHQDLLKPGDIIVKGFKLKGYLGSTAQKYAENNKMKFTAVNKVATPKVKITANKGSFKVKYTKVKGAKGFKVKYTVGKKSYTKKYETSKSGTKTITGLKKGVYEVVVRAYKQNNKSYAYSEPVTKTITVK